MSRSCNALAGNIGHLNVQISNMCLFPISCHYYLLVGYQELSWVRIWQCFLVSWDVHVVSESSNSSSWKKWPWHYKVLIWDIHVSFISSLIDLVIVLINFGKFWTIRSIVWVTDLVCFHNISLWRTSSVIPPHVQLYYLVQYWPYHQL